MWRRTQAQGVTAGIFDASFVLIKTHSFCKLWEKFAASSKTHSKFLSTAQQIWCLIWAEIAYLRVKAKWSGHEESKVPWCWLQLLLTPMQEKVCDFVVSGLRSVCRGYSCTEGACHYEEYATTIGTTIWGILPLLRWIMVVGENFRRESWSWQQTCCERPILVLEGKKTQMRILTDTVGYHWPTIHFSTSEAATCW